jgi:hypothetical protein
MRLRRTTTDENRQCPVGGSPTPSPWGGGRGVGPFTRASDDRGAGQGSWRGMTAGRSPYQHYGPLAVAPLRSAFAQERGHALALVLGVEQFDERLALGH